MTDALVFLWHALPIALLSGVTMVVVGYILGWLGLIPGWPDDHKRKRGKE